MMAMRAVVNDPEVLEFIRCTESFYSDEPGPVGVDDVRREYDRMCAAFRAPHPASVSKMDVDLGGVPARRYLRREAASGTGFVMYLHGGGFVTGSLESHDDICAEICEETGTEVIAIDYRLSPEHPYPAALDDATRAWTVLSETEGRGIAVGDSAGGMLAAALCIRSSRLGFVPPAGIVLIYPALGGGSSVPSYTEHADAPLFKIDDLAYYSNAYCGLPDWSFSADPELAPLNYTDFSIFPPTSIFTAEIDPLRDDGVAFTAALNAAGVEAKIVVERQLVHGYLRARHSSKRAKASFVSICEAVRDQTGSFGVEPATPPL